MEWSIFYMVSHPDIQAKVFEDIYLNIGERQVSLEDRNSTQYVQAVIEEIMR